MEKRPVGRGLILAFGLLFPYGYLLSYLSFSTIRPLAADK